MAPPPDEAPGIPPWLEHGLAHAGAQVCVLAQQAYRLRAVRINEPLLVVVLTGVKRVGLGAHAVELGSGQFVMVHQGASVHMENLPPGPGQPYRAWAISFPWRVVDLARRLLSAHPVSAVPDPTEVLSCGALELVLPALQLLLSALSQADAPPDPVRIDHALVGVLLALAQRGHRLFLHAGDPSLAARVRLLVAAAPQRDWSSVHVEATLHVSGATLRRHLAAENTSLRAVLRETRLHHGLALLQSSRKPLKAIASACGYRSVPSFSRNFTEHFGVEPLTLAQA